MKKRIFLFVILFVIAFSFPWWISVPCMVVYMVRYTAYEVIVLGALYDAQLGITVGAIPFLFTISLGVLFITLEAVKPFLSFYSYYDI